jgi:hypothetical protein
VWSDGAYTCRVGYVHLARLNRIDSPCLAVTRAQISLSHCSLMMEMIIIDDGYNELFLIAPPCLLTLVSCRADALKCSALKFRM